MKAVVSTVAVLASAAASTSAPSQPLSLECIGTGNSQGYPYGVQETGPTRYRVEGEGQRISILLRGYKDENLCSPGATCTLVATKDLVELQVSNAPNADPLYSTRFRLDPRRLVFEASGGGLGGGWVIAGTCTRERP